MKQVWLILGLLVVVGCGSSNECGDRFLVGPEGWDIGDGNRIIFRADCSFEMTGDCEVSGIYADPSGFLSAVSLKVEEEDPEGDEACLTKGEWRSCPFDGQIDEDGEATASLDCDE